MEKESFRIDYSGSGIRSLRFLSGFFVFVGIVGVILLVYSFSLLQSYSSSEKLLGGELLYGAISLVFSGIVISVLFRALSGIAENSLYQKTKLKKEIEKEYDIVEI